MPTLSLVIPAYNRTILLPEALDSVFAQTYPDYEAIVVDDESTNRTEGTLRLRFWTGGEIPL